MKRRTFLKGASISAAALAVAPSVLLKSDVATSIVLPSGFKITDETFKVSCPIIYGGDDVRIHGCTVFVPENYFDRYGYLVTTGEFKDVKYCVFSYNNVIGVDGWFI